MSINGKIFVFHLNSIKKEAKREPYQGVAENSSLANTTSFASANNILYTDENVNIDERSNKSKPP